MRDLRNVKGVVARDLDGMQRFIGQGEGVGGREKGEY